MKLIHTADIHLDSPICGVANPTERRLELLGALNNLAEYAKNNKAEAIIVAGDLFDGNNTSEQTVKSFAEIVRNSRATWFVLRGNHGGSAPYSYAEKIPNVKFFGNGWTPYSLGNVTVCGRELGADDVSYWQQLHLDPSRYNILVLHGDIDEPSYGFIDKSAIASCGAKYVALGHRHAFCQHRFGKVRACYSGVLEPRGFDECEQTGFVEIDTDSDVIKFVPQSIRSIVTKTLDVSGIENDVALERAVLDSVADVSSRNYLNFVLRGEINEGLHTVLVAKRVLEGKFFALRLKDGTRARLDLKQIMQEVSLRGEFVKLAEAIDDEELRSDVLKFGLAALGGEELL